MVCMQNLSKIIQGHKRLPRYLCSTSSRNRYYENIPSIRSQPFCGLWSRGPKAYPIGHLCPVRWVRYVKPEVKKQPEFWLCSSAFDNYFLQAQKVRQLIKDDFDRVFSVPNYFSESHTRHIENPDSLSRVDVLIHPSAIRTAPLLTNSDKSDLSSYVQDVLTVPASLAGLPALSIPTTRPSGRPMSNDTGTQREDQWPIGVSIVGQWGTDSVVMAIGKALEALQREW